MSLKSIEPLSALSTYQQKGRRQSDVSVCNRVKEKKIVTSYHQLQKRELYHPYPPPGPSTFGRTIYEQFDIVVKLDEQIRIQDQLWNEILQCTRTGDCTKDDIVSIHKLILTSPNCDIPDFTLPLWNESILVTLRNSVQSVWNEFM